MPLPHAGAHVGATHTLPRHIDAEALHVVPHPPQLCGSFRVFTHWSPHAIRPFEVHDAASKPPPPSPVVPSLVASAPPSIEVVVPPHATRHMHNASKALMTPG
jgi:hypothetical protein